MRRREFLGVLGGSAAGWPVVAWAQQAIPVVGYLGSGSVGPQTNAFLQGLSDAGFVDGRNVIVEYRSAGGQYEQLPALAADLVRRQVTMIAVFGGVHAALAAKAATTTIPIVFAIGSDPVKFGLVGSLNRPSGNVTGISFFTAELEAKRLDLLHLLRRLPASAVVGLWTLLITIDRGPDLLVPDAVRHKSAVPSGTTVSKTRVGSAP